MVPTTSIATHHPLNQNQETTRAILSLSLSPCFTPHTFSTFPLEILLFKPTKSTKPEWSHARTWWILWSTLSAKHHDTLDWIGYDNESQQHQMTTISMNTLPWTKDENGEPKAEMNDDDKEETELDPLFMQFLHYDRSTLTLPLTPKPTHKINPWMNRYWICMDYGQWWIITVYTRSMANILAYDYNGGPQMIVSLMSFPFVNGVSSLVFPYFFISSSPLLFFVVFVISLYRYVIKKIVVFVFTLFV